jgi:hypothetical protein
VTAQNDAGSASATSAGKVIQTPPQNTTAPSISGTPAAGKTLTCAKGTWTGSTPLTYSYKWLRDNAAIGAQTAASYTVKGVDVGHAIKCQVKAANNGGSATATSAGVVIKTPPANTAAPTISGTPKVGNTLSCSNGTWSGSAPITYTRQWLRAGAPIAGATGASYVATAADAGKFLTCKVTAHNVAGTASKVSAAVKVT